MAFYAALHVPGGDKQLADFEAREKAFAAGGDAAEAIEIDPIVNHSN